MVAVAPNGKVKDLESKRNERGRELTGKGKKKAGRGTEMHASDSGRPTEPFWSGWLVASRQL